MDEGNRKCMCVLKSVFVCVVMREWVGAEKEVAEKVEVKDKRQKATATDEKRKKKIETWTGESRTKTDDTSGEDRASWRNTKKGEKEQTTKAETW